MAQFVTLQLQSNQLAVYESITGTTASIFQLKTSGNTGFWLGQMNLENEFKELNKLDMPARGGYNYLFN